MGVVAMNNVSLTDRPFNQAANTYRSLLAKIAANIDQVPLAADPITARTGTAADLAAFGNGITVNDLVSVIQFDSAIMNAVAKKELLCLGYNITQRFTTNQVAAQYTLEVRHLLDSGPAVTLTELNRDIVVSPEGGANSATEFTVMGMQPAMIFEYDAGNDSYLTPERQTQAFLSPYRYGQQNGSFNVEAGLIQKGVLIFKGQDSVAQETTVLPLLVDEAGATRFLDFLDALFD
jgi:hypothetical protein